MSFIKLLPHVNGLMVITCDLRNVITFWMINTLMVDTIGIVCHGLHLHFCVSTVSADSSDSQLPTEPWRPCSHHLCRCHPWTVFDEVSVPVGILVLQLHS